MTRSVLSLCDRTGVAVKHWAAAGYPCYCVDVQHPVGLSPLGPNVTAVGADVLAWEGWRDIDVGFVMAFPPCTHLAGSGARWWASKGLAALIEGLTLVERCRHVAERCGAPWFIENPVGRLNTIWRKPDYSFDPCDFGGYLDPAGDAYTKRTCLWTGGGFVMPPKRPVEATEGSKMHLLPPSPDRANLRSVTPEGFARAVFEANEPLVARRVTVRDPERRDERADGVMAG